MARPFGLRNLVRTPTWTTTILPRRVLATLFVVLALTAMLFARP